MSKEIIMPALGMAQETGTLLRWLVEEGAPVKAGEPLMEVATDKVDVTIDAPASGVLAGVSAQEGDDIPVGQVIAYILAAGEPLPPPPHAGAGAVGGTGASGDTKAPDRLDVSPLPQLGDRAGAGGGGVPSPLPQLGGGVGGGGVVASPVAARMAAEHGIDLAVVPAQGGRIQKGDVLAYLESRQAAAVSPGRVLASPKARRLATENGVDLVAIPGSGPNGAVLAADVKAWQPRPAPALIAPIEEGVDQGQPTTEISVSRAWQVMAQRLSESWATVPHFYLVRDVDASALQVWRRQAQARADVKITVSDLLIKVTAIALTRHPRVNASWDDGRIVTHPAVNLGLAVAVEDGLLVPVLHAAETLGLREIAARRADLVGRSQAGKLTLDDLSGGTFTISNLGMFGVDAFNAIVNPPQAAILAVGRIAERVVAVDGQPAVRPMLTLTLSCDHRAVDGARAARFLDELAALIEDPLRALE